MISEEKDRSRRIAKNTILLFIRMIFLLFIGLFTSRVNLQSLGIEDYGIYNVVGGVVAMFTIITSTMSASISRYITYELGCSEKSERLNIIYSSAIRVQWYLAGFIFIFAELIGVYFLNTQLTIPIERMFAANCVLQCSIITFVVNIISVPYNAIIVAHERMSAFAYLSLLEAVAKLTIAYLLFITKFDRLILYAVLLMILQLILRMIYRIYCKRNFQECRSSGKFDKSILRQMTGFAGWNLVGTFAWIANSQGLNILLNIFFGPSVNAARGIAVQIQNSVKGFCKNYQMAINPQITKSYANNDLCYMHKLIYTSSKFSYYILFILILPFLIKTESILNIWLVEVPSHTVSFMKIMLIILLFDSMANPLNTSALANGNLKKFQLSVETLQILVLPISYIVLHIYPIPELVFAIDLFIVVIAQFVRLKIVSQMVSLSISEYTKKVYFRIVLVSISSFVLPYLMSMLLPDNFINTIIICIVCVLSVALTIYLLGLENNEKQIVLDKIGVVIRKFIK